MIYTWSVTYVAAIVILYLVQQQALAHTLMITGPLLMLCWVGMRLMVFMGALLGALAHSTGTLQGQMDISNQGLAALSNGLRAIIAFLQAAMPFILKDAGLDDLDWDAEWRKTQGESEER